MILVEFQDYNDDFEGQWQFLKDNKGNDKKFNSIKDAQECMEDDVNFFISQNCKQGLGDYEKEIRHDSVKVEFKDHGHGCNWRIRTIT